MTEKVELAVPSIFGYEEVVAETVGVMARFKGFPFEKISKLKTAVAESCVNAIEHGNGADADKDVIVTILAEEDSLCVNVRDFGEGHANPNFEKPDLKGQIADKALGGWGMYLMHSLVDEVKVVDADDGGTITTLIIRSETESE